MDPKTRPKGGRVTPTLRRTLRTKRGSLGEKKLLHVANWLAHQAGHHPHLRSAIHPFQRLALTTHADERTIRRTSVQTPFPDAFVVLGESEPIHREWLSTIEHMVLDQGLEETVMQIAPQFPRLTELLTDAEVFTQFIESGEVPQKWKKPLQLFAHTPNEQLRAVGLLLYLRKAYRTPSTNLNERTLQLVKRLS